MGVIDIGVSIDSICTAISIIVILTRLDLTISIVGITFTPTYIEFAIVSIKIES